MRIHAPGLDDLLMHAAIPLFDCRLDAEARRVLDPVLASGALATGQYVRDLEMRLESLLAPRSAVAMGNLTQAIAVALHLSGIGPGDEVLTLALNCMASNSAIPLSGATPVWVDVDPTTLTVDLADCARAITPRTKALIVYHVAGYPADLTAIEQFCDDHGITLIEDANSAFGARSDGRRIGTAGRFSVVSFYANRQVNAIEGAGLLCADAMDAARARRLRRFGVDATRFRDADGEIAADTDVPELGFPFSMTNINARLGCHNMESLSVRLRAVEQNAAVFRQALTGTHLEPIPWRECDHPAFWTFFVRTRRRDDLMRLLKAKGIQCSKLHQANDRYSGFSAERRELPGTVGFEREILALPVGWWLEPPQRNFIVNSLRQWLASKD